jgi:hypothetical protein
MAKGQKRGNREIKKPKQNKAAPQPASPFRSLTGLSAPKEVKRVTGKANAS